jgi:serine/threonine protein kinase
MLHDVPVAMLSKEEKEREVSVIALEYVPGSVTLDAVIKKGLSERKCWHYFKQLMEAVKQIHGSDEEFQATGYVGQAHRDLKPANILVTPE